ncbi:hypothetical protein BDW59DRAFT_176921 [Aspergillus cavernicola]|uniref:Secreted protein n=1 Tax=Aspergillus cavernicola TaxID=176166 RepID=A0ABR4HBD1_9EURO
MGRASENMIICFSVLLSRSVAGCIIGSRRKRHHATGFTQTCNGKQRAKQSRNCLLLSHKFVAMGSPSKKQICRKPITVPVKRAPEPAAGLINNPGGALQGQSEAVHLLRSDEVDSFCKQNDEI